MLENQQVQLVSGLQELYRRLHTRRRWRSSCLKDTARDTPFIRDILRCLGILDEARPTVSDNSDEGFKPPTEQIISEQCYLHAS